MQKEQIKLPENCVLVGKDDITSEEIIDVRQSTGWAGGTEESWKLIINTALAVVGVRDSTTGILLGVGFLVGNQRHAILCDFSVRSEHQDKGIGTVILNERMRIANELRIPFLYTNLSESNPLREKYETFGFVPNGNTYCRELK